MTFKISFLPRLCRGKKHFYPREYPRQRLTPLSCKKLRLLLYARSVHFAAGKMRKATAQAFAGDSFGGKAL